LNQTFVQCTLFLLIAANTNTMKIRRAGRITNDGNSGTDGEGEEDGGKVGVGVDDGNVNGKDATLDFSATTTPELSESGFLVETKLPPT
jgi:hypothetical protein